jgi:hypothetical protein
MNHSISIIVAAIIVGCGIAYWFGLMPGPVDRVVGKSLEAAGMVAPDELGWMDDAPLTDADRQRIAEITGRGSDSNISVIRQIQGGARGIVTRRDFELLRQDRRRARAAYPDVAEDDLFGGTWLNVDVGARVPSSFCTSHNSNGTKVDGKWYLDGGCYVSGVSAQYTERADAATTRRVLAELNDQKRQKTIDRLARWGYFGAWSGTGGSASINCYPDPLPSNHEADDQHVAGQCVIVIDEAEKYGIM